MALIRTEEDLIAELAPVVEGLGYRIVEAKQAKVRGTIHVTLVIFSAGGVSVDGCADVSRTIMPRLELLFGSSEISLEVGSPGIDRTIKNNREFEIFSGRGVRMLLRDTGDWVSGVIRGVDGENVEIDGEAGTRSVPLTNIQKAKLDEAQEVG